MTRDYQRENAQKLAYDLGYRLEQKNSPFEYRGINKLTNQYLNRIYDNKNIVLTKERKNHILESHPEVKLSEKVLYNCINNPDYMCEDISTTRNNPNTYNCIKSIGDGKNIFITLKMSISANKDNSIISALIMNDKKVRKYEQKHKNLIDNMK